MASTQVEPAEVAAEPNGKSPQTALLFGLLALAVLYTLRAASSLFLPIFLAVLFDLLLAPPVRWLARAGLPYPLAAGLVLVVLFGGVGAGAYRLSSPASEFLQHAPDDITRARRKLRDIIRPMEAVRRTAEEVQEAAGAGETPSKAPSVTVVQTPTLVSRLFGTTQAFLVGFFEMAILLYFLLAAGPLFTQKIVKVLPKLRDKKKAVEIVRAVESSVSRYLGTLAVINVAEGAALSGVLYLIGLPNPVLWGVLCALLIFIPYIGATVMVAILLLVGATTFDGPGAVLMPAAAFFVIDIIQANLITPHILGRRMLLNPVAIFLSILLWGEIWGIAGIFMAVPLLVIAKIFCDHVESLSSVGEFLGN